VSQSRSLRNKKDRANLFEALDDLSDEATLDTVGLKWIVLPRRQRAIRVQRANRAGLP
jgi:hypothetical protein